MRALIRIRPEPYYRRAAFESGLKRLGFMLVNVGVPSGPEDWLIIWNRQNADEQMADNWERLGGTVIVAENGYLQRVDKSMYAISVHGHCGSGWFPVGDEDRFTPLGFPLKPWREPTDHSLRLVCGQRGVGSREMKSPTGWAENLCTKFRKLNVPHRFRPHPGNFAPKTALVKDLADATVCVIWSSAAGVQALIEGVEVHHSAPHWICAGGNGEKARPEALQRMSHGQWRHKEIATGEPFARLIAHRKEAVW